VINELPDRLRDTFLLHFEEELPYKTIAKQLNISYENVRKRISQVRAILREHLAEYWGEEEGANPYLKERKSKEKELITDENLALSEEIKELEVVGEDEKPKQSEKPGFCNAVGTRHQKIMSPRQNFNYTVLLQKCWQQHASSIIPLHAETVFLRANTFNKETDSS